MSDAKRGGDFLAVCKATDSRNKALEEIKDKGADVILAVFRMFKNSLVHKLDNDAVQQTTEETHAMLIDFAGVVGGQVSITYVDDTIFICGQLLRASRSIYESAMEVGNLLGRCGASEITFAPEVTYGDLMTLLEAFSISARDPDRRGALLEAKLTNCAVRRLDTSLQAASEDDSAATMDRSLAAYASALVVMRQYFERVAEGKTVLPHRVKRLAQRMVAQASEDEGSLMAMTTMANGHRDYAGRSVQCAILTVVIARRLTEDRTILSQLAMSALLADVGRVRIGGTKGLNQFIRMGEDVERAIPALTSAIGISTGGVNIQNALRTVTTFESTVLERQELLGPLYKGAMTPMVQSRVMHVVRELLERLAPRDATVRAMSPLDALADLAQQDDIDETAFKLLVQAVGVLPTGTVVEFETGEWGIVVGPSANPQAIARPRIKLVTDRGGQVFPKPKLIDLGAPSAGRRFPPIAGIVDPDKAKFNIAGLLMAEGTMHTMMKLSPTAEASS